MPAAQQDKAVSRSELPRHPQTSCSTHRIAAEQLDMMSHFAPGEATMNATYLRALVFPCVHQVTIAVILLRNKEFGRLANEFETETRELKHPAENNGRAGCTISFGDMSGAGFEGEPAALHRTKKETPRPFETHFPAR